MLCKQDSVSKRYDIFICNVEKALAHAKNAQAFTRNLNQSFETYLCGPVSRRVGPRSGGGSRAARMSIVPESIIAAVVPGLGGPEARVGLEVLQVVELSGLL